MPFTIGITWYRILIVEEWLIIYQTTNNGETAGIIDKQTTNEFIIPKQFCCDKFLFNVTNINQNSQQSKFDEWIK